MWELRDIGNVQLIMIIVSNAFCNSIQMIMVGVLVNEMCHVFWIYFNCNLWFLHSYSEYLDENCIFFCSICSNEFDDTGNELLVACWYREYCWARKIKKIRIISVCCSFDLQFAFSAHKILTYVNDFDSWIIVFYQQNSYQWHIIIVFNDTLTKLSFFHIFLYFSKFNLFIFFNTNKTKKNICFFIFNFKLNILLPPYKY